MAAGCGRVGNVVLTAGFVAALWLPGLALCAGRFLGDSGVKPGPSRPAFRLSLEGVRRQHQYLSNLITAKFGFREELISLRGRLRHFVMGDSPSEDLIRGRSGWLFYAGQDLVAECRGTHPLSEEDLGAWAAHLESTRAWLAEQGIAYVFLACPNKHSIYSEYLPERLARVKGAPHIDQLLGFMADRSRVRVVDVRPALHRAKAREQVYGETDSRWNDWGAYVGCGVLINELASLRDGVAPWPTNDVELIAEEHAGGNLAGMVFMERFFRERRVQVVPTADMPATPGAGPVRRPRCVVFHDCFFELMKPFLSDRLDFVSCEDTRFNRTRLEAILASERVDIVIEERAERLLKDPPRLRR